MFSFFASIASNFVAEVVSGLVAFGVAMAMNYVTSLFWWLKSLTPNLISSTPLSYTSITQLLLVVFHY